MLKKSIFVLGAAVVMLAGCGGPSLVGEWEGSTKMQGMDMKMAMNYKSDGNLEGKAIMTPPGLKEMTLVLKGTYKQSGEELKTNLTSFDIQGLDPNIKKMLEPTMKKDLLKETVSKIKFINKDEVEMTSKDGDTLTLKRK